MDFCYIIFLEIFDSIKYVIKYNKVCNMLNNMNLIIVKV